MTTACRNRFLRGEHTTTASAAKDDDESHGGGARDIALSYAVTGPPETYLTDPAGVLITKVIGPVREANLEQLLSQATAANG